MSKQGQGTPWWCLKRITLYTSLTSLRTLLPPDFRLCSHRPLPMDSEAQWASQILAPTHFHALTHVTGPQFVYKFNTQKTRKELGRDFCDCNLGQGKIDQWLTGASLLTIPETIAGRISGRGARFSKAPIIDGSVKLLLFTCKMEVSMVLHLTW